MNDCRMSLAFATIVEYVLSHGATRLDKVPGCFERDVDERWHIALNAHNEPTKDSSGCPVPAFECAITYNGWPAGIVGPYGGVMAAGSGANEDAFIDALRQNMGSAEREDMTEREAG